MNFSIPQKKSSYNNSHVAIRDFIASVESMEKTSALSKKFALSKNQDIILDNEVMLVLTGLETKDDLIQNLQEKAKITKNKAVEIFIDTDKEIFQRFRQWMSPRTAAVTSRAGQTAETLMGTQELPDASAGLIADHEEIQKNPIKTTENKQPTISNQRPMQQAPVSIPKPQPIQVNIQPKSTVSQPAQQIPTPPKITSLPNTQMSWEERKKKAEEALKNIAPVETKKYPGGADPYREPV